MSKFERLREIVLQSPITTVQDILDISDLEWAVTQVVTEDWAGQIERGKDEIESLREEISEYKIEAESSSDEVEGLEYEVNRLESDNEDLRGEVRYLEDKVGDLEFDLETAWSTGESLTAELASARAELETASTERDEALTNA